MIFLFYLKTISSQVIGYHKIDEDYFHLDMASATEEEKMGHTIYKSLI